jgi:hypothetical protein
VGGREGEGGRGREREGERETEKKVDGHSDTDERAITLYARPERIDRNETLMNMC